MRRIFQTTVLKFTLIKLSRRLKGRRFSCPEHPNLLKRLFEEELPEIFDGTVEVMSVAREAGERSKISVHAKTLMSMLSVHVSVREVRVSKQSLTN